jgi:hypothetical protein
MSAASENFGDAVQRISAHSLDGNLMNVVQMALPVVASTAPFLVRYFTALEASKKVVGTRISSRMVLQAFRGDKSCRRGYRPFVERFCSALP